MNKTTTLFKNMCISLSILTIFALGNSKAQTIDCANIGFSENSFANWYGKTGTYLGDRNPLDPFSFPRGPIASSELPSITSPINGYTNCYKNTSDKYRFVINNDTAECDPILPTNSLKKIPKGYIHSARLGNSCGGGEAEALYYRFKVTPEVQFITLKYAIIAENPSHDGLNNPSFNILVKKESATEPNNYSEIINDIFINITNTNVNSDNDFYLININQENFLYSSWKTAFLDLRNYIDSNIELEIRINDCQFEAHFAYAYFTAKSNGEIQLSNTAYAGTSDTISIIQAPEANSYKWVLSRTDTNHILSTKKDFYLTIADFNEEPSIDLTCYIESLTPDNNYIPLSITIKNSKPIISVSHTVQRNKVVEFVSSVVTHDAEIDSTLQVWDFGDGTTSNEKSPTHQYEEDGTYKVKYTASTVDGYTSSKEIIVEVKSMAVSSLPFIKDHLVISPNPSNDILKINSAVSISKIEILNMQGKCMYSKKNILQKSHQIDVSSLTSGVYIIKLTFDGNKTISQKVIKN